MQIQTVFRAGNSNVVAIPKEVSEKLGLKKGTKVIIETTPDNRIIVRRADDKRKGSVVTHEFYDWLEDFNNTYGPALKELAGK